MNKRGPLKLLEVNLRLQILITVQLYLNSDARRNLSRNTRNASPGSVLSPLLFLAADQTFHRFGNRVLIVGQQYYK